MGNFVEQGKKLDYVNVSNFRERKMHIRPPVEKPVESVKNSAGFRGFLQFYPGADRGVFHLIHSFLYRGRQERCKLCFQYKMLLCKHLAERFCVEKLQIAQLAQFFFDYVTEKPASCQLTDFYGRIIAKNALREKQTAPSIRSSRAERFCSLCSVSRES